VIGSDAERAVLSHGLQIDDVRGDRALIWARTNREARLRVEWDSCSARPRCRTATTPRAWSCAASGAIDSCSSASRSMT